MHNGGFNRPVSLAKSSFPLQPGLQQPTVYYCLSHPQCHIPHKHSLSHIFVYNTPLSSIVYATLHLPFISHSMPFVVTMRESATGKLYSDCSLHLCQLQVIISRFT